MSWHDVDCPVCPAKAGHRCRNKAKPSRASATVHAERVNLWTEADREHERRRDEDRNLDRDLD